MNLDDQQWADGAACAEIGPLDDVFFPPASNQTAEAKAVCATCPVRIPCYERAIEISLRESPVYGVWGASSRAERADVLRTMQKRCPDCGTPIGRPGNGRPKRCDDCRANAQVRQGKRDPREAA